MLKGRTNLDAAISSWDVLCCGDCQSLDLECPFRSFKVLLIPFADSIASFLGKMFLANLLEYLSDRLKELSSNTSIFGMEGHKTSGPEAGFVLSSWTRARWLVWPWEWVFCKSSAPFPAWQLRMPGLGYPCAAQQSGVPHHCWPVKVPSPHPLTLPNSLSLCLFGFLSLYRYSKRLHGNHGLSWADVDDIKHTFHFPGSPLKNEDSEFGHYSGCVYVCMSSC